MSLYYEFVFLIYLLIKDTRQETSLISSITAVGHSVIRGLVTTGQWLRRKSLLSNIVNQFFARIVNIERS